jgi:hypothetical protein
MAADALPPLLAIHYMGMTAELHGDMCVGCGFPLTCLWVGVTRAGDPETVWPVGYCTVCDAVHLGDVSHLSG